MRQRCESHARFAVATLRCGMIAALFCFGLGAWAQDSSNQSLGNQSSGNQSLGDVARKTRKERSEPHPLSRELVSEEDQPDATGVWRIKVCLRTPCSELTITLPKDARWIRASDEPRPVLIPIAGAGSDPDHVIQLYAAEALEPAFLNVDLSVKALLQSWFARPEYFGVPARITLNEHVMIDNHPAVISHFSVTSAGTKYHGLSVVAGTASGNYGFACVFRDEDASSATSTCDAIVKSAHNQVLEPARPQYYPQAPYYPPYNPADP
jgi:hypothetical protein